MFRYALAALLLAGCADQGAPEPAIAVTIVSPEAGAAFEDEAVTVRFTVEDNVGGATVTATAGDAEVSIELAAGAVDGEITVTPAADSGDVTIDLAAVASPRDVDQDSVPITWAAPWEITPIECHGSTCDPIDATSSLSGTEDLGATPTWDADRLDRVEVTIDDAAVDDLDPDDDRVRVDVDPLVDGEVMLAVTAVRDDGETVTVMQRIAITNCARVTPVDQDPVLVYTTGGLAVTGSDRVTVRDLHTGGADVPSLTLAAPVGALTVDETARRIYAGLEDSLVSLRLDEPSFATTTLDAAAPVLSMTLGPDGAIYWTRGVRGESVDGRIFRTEGTTTTRVDVGGVSGADGLVFDDDGTLLVAGGETIVRLTLTDGAETARATVLTDSGTTLTLIALDDAGHLFAVDRTDNVLLRWNTPSSSPAVVHQSISGVEPASLSFVRYPPNCHGLMITRPGFLDHHDVVDVGPVRGRP